MALNKAKDLFEVASEIENKQDKRRVVKRFERNSLEKRCFDHESLYVVSLNVVSLFLFPVRNKSEEDFLFGIVWRGFNCLWNANMNDDSFMNLQRLQHWIIWHTCRDETRRDEEHRVIYKTIYECTFSVSLLLMKFLFFLYSSLNFSFLKFILEFFI